MVYIDFIGLVVRLPGSWRLCIGPEDPYQWVIGVPFTLVAVVRLFGDRLERTAAIPKPS